VTIPLPDTCRNLLRQRFDLVQLPAGSPAALPLENRNAIRAVVTNGSTGFSAESMSAFPQLKLIACFGAGYEAVDLDAAGARGIHVTCAPGANTDTVADHAIGLMLAVMRDIPGRNTAVRNGQFSTSRSERPTLSRVRLGILGLGQIGRAIARRAAAFDMQVAYTSRRPKTDRPWRHMEKLTDLAQASDILVVACPGGPATRNLVDAGVLAALGADGFLINIARGSVVNTSALAEALVSGRIAGAALDVWEGEPELPELLKEAPNLVLTPHMAGRSPDALVQQAEILAENLDAMFAGRPLRPETLVVQTSLA
jgi:D-3-phosphoglycerate dehydrogenase